MNWLQIVGAMAAGAAAAVIVGTILIVRYFAKGARF